MSEQIQTIKPFEFKTTKENLEQIIKLSSVIVDDEIKIQLDNEGLYIATMDSSHVCLLDIALPNSLFEKYEVNDKVLFNIRIKDFLKIIAQFDKNESITCKPTKDKKDNDVLNLTSHELSFNVRMFEANDNNTPLPRIPYDASISLYGNDLKKYLNKMYVIDNYQAYVNMVTTNHKCTLSNSNDDNECIINLDKGHPKLIDINVKQESNSTYSLEYLIPYFKAFNENVIHQLEYSSMKPLRINSKVFNVGRIHYYLAPRVEN